MLEKEQTREKSGEKPQKKKKSKERSKSKTDKKPPLPNNRKDKDASNNKKKDYNEVIDTVRSRARDDENSSMLPESAKKKGKTNKQDLSRFNEQSTNHNADNIETKSDLEDSP